MKDRWYYYRVVGVKSVNDGDSAKLIVDVGFEITATVAVRLAHIDAPELGTPGATEARDYLRQNITVALAADNLSLHTQGKDKYGRYLSELFDGEESINERLVKEGHAVQYEGGKRVK